VTAGLIAGYHTVPPIRPNDGDGVITGNQAGYHTIPVVGPNRSLICQQVSKGK